MGSVAVALSEPLFQAQLTCRQEYCKYEHEISTDYQGVEAPTTMRNKSSFRGSSVWLVFSHYAHLTTGASLSDAQQSLRSQKLRVRGQVSKRFNKLTQKILEFDCRM